VKRTFTEASGGGPGCWKGGVFDWGGAVGSMRDRKGAHCGDGFAGGGGGWGVFGLGGGGDRIFGQVLRNERGRRTVNSQLVWTLFLTRECRKRPF